MVKQRFLPILIFFLLSSFTAALAQDAAQGKTIFDANCTSCHAMNDKVVGPALKDAHKRQSEAWLIKWIKNSQAVVKSGDPYAVKIYKENNESVMTSFESLSDNDIKSVIAYIKQESEKPADVAGTTGTTSGGKVAQGDSLYNKTTMYALLVMAIILFIVVLILFRIRSTVKSLFNEKYPEVAAENPDWYTHVLIPTVKKWNPTLVVMFAVTFIVVIGGAYGYKFGMDDVGVQKGYAPEQPIKFSHEIHAGQYKMDCQYCHTTASKSKQASIPSASTCMNCHMHVTAKDKYEGQISPEIQKIYAAINWDPVARKYDESKPKTPIKWIRIHNLPDHAYFNHSQHVTVGKQKCQTCHGPVETMTTVRQHATLQMGWCINCHIETNVDVENNKYYEDFHKKLKADGITTVKVKNIGGLECSKCHY